MSAPGDGGVETEANEENSTMGNVDETGDDIDPADLDQPLIAKVRQWLILLTQWYHVLADLKTYLPDLCNDLTAPLKIRARHADHAPNPRQQAALFKTLEFIDPKIGLQMKLTAIKAVASDKTTTDSQALRVLRNLKDDQLEDPKEWAEAFVGGIHCEAQLYQDLKEIGIPHAVIGVSRRCCFCCNRLLEDAQLFPATHGRVYSWASPSDLDAESRRSILDDLKKHLQTFFSAARARSRTRESSPETSGLSASGDSPRRMPPNENSLIQNIPW